MASNKKTSAPKKAPAVLKGSAEPAKAVEAAPAKTADTAPKDAAPAKTERGDAGGAPKNYSRGEGQKPVTQAYKDNWNAIFGKKKNKR
jgi:hypothetical protein